MPSIARNSHPHTLVDIGISIVAPNLEPGLIRVPVPFGTVQYCVLLDAVVCIKLASRPAVRNLPHYIIYSRLSFQGTGVRRNFMVTLLQPEWQAPMQFFTILGSLALTSHDGTQQRPTVIYCNSLTKQHMFFACTPSCCMHHLIEVDHTPCLQSRYPVE